MTTPPVNREIQQSPVAQGAEEIISYTLDTTPWGGSPSIIEVSVYDETERLHTPVTDDVMPINLPAVDDNIITLSPMLDLTVGNVYRVEVQWTSAGNTFMAYCIIHAER